MSVPVTKLNNLKITIMIKITKDNILRIIRLFSEEQITGIRRSSSLFVFIKAHEVDEQKIITVGFRNSTNNFPSGCAVLFTRQLLDIMNNLEELLYIEAMNNMGCRSVEASLN